MFFSSSSVKDTKLLYDFGIKEILVSFHYIQKGLAYYDELLVELKKNDGLFMTDSGGFSFIASINLQETPEASTEKFWLPYLERYVAWLYEHRDYIYVAANLDLDAIVGREVVLEWNEKYFRPLEKYMNIVYVAHRDISKVYNDYDGLKQLKEYCSAYDYVGVSQEYKEYSSKVYTIAKNNGTRIHGFAWTSIPLLKANPFFSVDSTTWLGGVRYGTSYRYDGKNFVVNDHKKKYVRKVDKLLCLAYNINHKNLLAEKREEINRYNLIGWLGARSEYLRMAKVKLKNKVVAFYEKQKGINKSRHVIRTHK
jgi:hypothetical protein